jgi:dienelactone hydrolase
MPLQHTASILPHEKPFGRLAAGNTLPLPFWNECTGPETRSMRNRRTVVAVGLVVAGLVSASCAPAAEALEVERPVRSAAYQEGMAAAEGLDPLAATGIHERTLDRVSAPAERYQLMFARLSFRYAETREWRKLMALLRKGQSEGLYFPFQTGARSWPDYVVELAKLDGFSAFLCENDRLRNEAQKNARLEYFVEKPVGYTPEKKFPLVLVLHGGVGGHAALADSWHSSQLASGCLVAYVQGSDYRGSFSRAYANDDSTGLLAAYRQILDRYAVDPSRVILAGQSNGGRRAIQMAVRGEIPTKGLILAFPTKPAELDVASLQKAARHGLRTVMLCGAKDGGFAAQEEMRELFERANAPLSFLSFPDKGHEFPDEFPAHLDRALAFILGCPDESRPYL